MTRGVWQVTPVDTVCAGDAYAGAFTVTSANRMPLEEAIYFANAAGAMATQAIGAQSSIPRARCDPWTHEAFQRTCRM